MFDFSTGSVTLNIYKLGDFGAIHSQVIQKCPRATIFEFSTIQSILYIHS